MANALDVHLLLARHDDHQPVVGRGLDSRSVANEPEPEKQKGGVLSGRRTGNVGDLAEQRWGVVVPAGDTGDALLEVLAPLIEMRRDQQGAEVAVFRSAPGFASDLSLGIALEWQDLFVDNYQQLDDELPCYLLIAGDLDQVPLSVQHALSANASRMVGRLGFDRLDDYRAYAEKLCSLERSEPENDLGRAVFHSVQDGTEATSMGHDLLVNRVAGKLKQKMPGQTSQLGEARAGPDEFLSSVRAATEPTLLFTLSHGEGAPAGGWPSSEEQRRYQGTMCFGRGQRLDHTELLQRHFLPGGMWFYLACYGAGTPAGSPYLRWLEKRARGSDDLAEIAASRPLSGRPFISQLARAALAHPQGPCGFIGHVDLAWTFSFRDPDDAAGSRPGHFARMCGDILAGHRFGQGLRAICDYMAGPVATRLLTLYAEQHNEDARALWWMMWHDLAGYILLGDPAARLPVRRNRPLATAPVAVPGAVRPADADRLERAIAWMMLGHRPEKARRKAHLARPVEELNRLAERFRKAGFSALGWDEE